MFKIIQGDSEKIEELLNRYEKLFVTEPVAMTSTGYSTLIVLVKLTEKSSESD